MIALTIMLLGAIGGSLAIWDAWRTWKRQIQGNRIVRRVTE